MWNRYEGGDLLVESLKNLGVGQIFSLSGKPLNSIYHAAANHGVRLVHVHHEAAAVYMADGVARASGVPGVAAVTLGPGSINAVTPAWASRMAGTPLLIVGGQGNPAEFDRGADMSADLVRIMTPVTKFAARVLHTERIPEYVEAAWRTMWAGRPGPVFLEIPINVVSAAAERQDPASGGLRVPGLAPGDADAIAAALARARRPLAIIGDSVRWEMTRGFELASLQSAIERHGLPFITIRLGRGAIDERHPLSCGSGCMLANATLRQGLEEADLILLLGHHFETDLGYGETVGAGTTIVQCHADGEFLGKNRRPTVGALAGVGPVVDLLLDLEPMAIDKDWVEAMTGAWRAEWAGLAECGAEDRPLHPVAAVDAVRAAMPEDTVFVTGEGNVDCWADVRLLARAPDMYMRVGQAGALGAEIPYGIGAKLVHPERPVVVFVGDGGFGYHAFELETAVRYGCPIIVVLLADEKWGAVAVPQKDDYGSEFEMDLPARDWHKFGEIVGGFGARAETVEEIGAAMRAAHESGRTFVVQVPVRCVLSSYLALAQF